MFSFELHVTNCAAEGSLPCVRSDVHGQAILVKEGLLTHLTLVWALASMSFQMAGQSVFELE